jgi:lipoprotein-anchoring transpeptidase ErfK/SrfK
MQPFAQNSAPRVPLYWWLTGIGATAFTIWALDLFPRVQSVPTGEVAGLTAAAEARSDDVVTGAVSAPDADWDADSDSPPQWTELSEPPVDDAAPRETENAGRWQPRPRPIRDRAVKPAAHEAESDSAAAAADMDLNDDSPPENGSQSEILNADFADTLQQARTFLKSGHVLDAHAQLSRLYWKYPAQRRAVRQLLQQTAAEIFESPESQFGEPHVVEYGETLESIGRQYEVPWQYLAKLNRVTPAKLQAGHELKVVRGPFGAVVDLSAFTLTVHAHGWYVRDYRIGTGKDGKTPIGRFSVQEKLENPVWYDPDGGVVEADDPENPLGEYWIGLGNHIGIHGTIDPESIGKAASRGCIHLGDKDIQDVFGLLGSGSEVMVRK